jgi:sec-independent protein translocase protein TatB
MFDIGFAEMLVIAVVALIVIGPQRLPKAARTLGAFFGRMQRYVADVKADVEREMELEELRKFKTNVEETAREFQSTVHAEMREAEKKFDEESAPIKQELASTSRQLDLALSETSSQKSG